MKLLLTIIVLVSSLSVGAQDSEYKRKTILKEIRGYVKAENYSKVDGLLKSTMDKYPEARTDAEFYNIWMNAHYNLALAENRKIYLKTNPDTTRYMDFIYTTYAYGLKCDSLDRIPNEKGKVKRKYKDNVNSKFSFFEKNLANAGKFFYKKADYDRTYRFVDMYLKVKLRNKGVDVVPITDSIAVKYLGKDDAQLAVLAVLSSFTKERYPDVIKMVPVARMDSSRMVQILEIACKSYKLLGDEVSYLGLLEECFDKYPNNEYFFASLIKNFNDKGQSREALELAREAVARDKNNRNYWFVKGAEEQICQLPDSAIVSFKNAIMIKHDDAESYSGIADIYLKKANEEDKNMTASYSQFSSKIGRLRAKAKLNSMYSVACDNYEKAREFAPEVPELWLDGLKECYYKLNKGDELKQLEKEFK